MPYFQGRSLGESLKFLKEDGSPVNTKIVEEVDWTYGMLMSQVCKDAFAIFIFRTEIYGIRYIILMIVCFVTFHPGGGFLPKQHTHTGGK